MLMVMPVRKLESGASGDQPVLSFGSDRSQPIPNDRRDRDLLRHPGHRPGVPTVVLLEAVGRRYRIGTNVVDALQHVDLEIDEGEFAVVLGPSGSGKSTLLNIIGALDVATSGRVTVASRDLSGASRAELFRFRREVVSFVFQTFNLFPTLTALENVQCGAEITRGLLTPGVAPSTSSGKSGSPTACITTRVSCRAASSSGLRSPGRWEQGVRCCSPTNRPATSTSAPESRSSSCCGRRRRPATPSSS
jgi:ABC transporter